MDIINDINGFNTSLIDDDKYQTQINGNERIKYDFIGDVFGFVTIISKKYQKTRRERLYTKKPKENLNDEKNKKKNKYDRPTINFDNQNDDKDKERYIIIRLSDHYEQIKYIDYNPRLNLFLTYALDGYINIYTFPKVKLIRTLKIEDYYEKGNHLKKVVLISNPFPMIFCHTDTKMFVFSINGELIKSKKIENSTEFIPCIDKDLGLIRDHVEMRTRMHHNNKNTVLSKDLYFPLI